MFEKVYDDLVTHSISETVEIWAEFYANCAAYTSQLNYLLKNRTQTPIIQIYYLSKYKNYFSDRTFKYVKLVKPEAYTPNQMDASHKLLDEELIEERELEIDRFQI